MTSRLTLPMIFEATRRALERRGDVIAKALLFANDTQRAERIERMLCPNCAYGGPRFAGQAFTSWKCLQCDKEGQHHNTAVPRLCMDCAKELGLCSWCCADINLETRRKVRIRKSDAKRKIYVKKG